MTTSDLSRRGLLGAGVGLGAAAVTFGQLPASAVPGRDRRGVRLRPVSMSMHTHSCFSEGGSYAGGGGGASMMSQLEAAQSAGVDVIWWTDHDWRMQAFGYYDGIAFDGTDEDGKLSWQVQSAGDLAEEAHEFVAEPHSPDEAGRALRVSATGTGEDWASSLSWAKAGNSFYSTNISDTTLTVDVLADQVGPDAELVVQLETSYRPATAGRPAGVYVLEYRVGEQDGRSLETPLTGVVTVAAQDGWQTLTMRPLRDVRRLWPDLVAGDSGLARLRFGVRARAGATGVAVFDHLRIERTRDQLQWPVQTQRDLMRQLGRRYPGTRQLLSAEVSMIRHLNVFMEDFELYPYEPRGKAPSLDRSVEAAERVIAWYHDRDALVQYNHPPNDPAELVATRALGTDLMEVADAVGDFAVTEERIDLFDVAARNAIFLTATSQIDDHAGRDWRNKQHLYLTSVWAESTRARHLLAGLGSGAAWCHHQGLWPTGRLDLRVGDQAAMGRVLRTEVETLPVDVVAENLPEGATLDLVVGECDRSGATEPSVRRTRHPAATFVSAPLRVELDRSSGVYLRVEVRDDDGVLLGYGNPLWLLPADADVTVPDWRGLDL